MSDRFEQRLEYSLCQRAESLTATRISAEEVVRAGRVAAVRRRIAAVGAVATSVATVLIVVAVVTVGRPTGAPAPGDKRGPKPEPSATTGAGVTPAALDLDVRYDNVVERPGGQYVQLPFSQAVQRLNRVPDGWVALVFDERGPAVWYVADNGTATRIGGHDYALTRDGGTLVVTGVESPTSVSAYQVPFGQRFRRTDFDGGYGPQVVGIGGVLVLLRAAQGSPGPSRAAVWNLHDGSLVATDESAGNVWAWGISRDGRVLRRVDKYGPDRRLLGVCVDVVKVTNRLPVEPTGLCHPEVTMPEGAGQLSPSGEWVVLRTATQGTVLLRTADLTAGRWQPVPIKPAGSGLPAMWTSDTTFIADGPITADEPPTMQHCSTAGECVPIVFARAHRVPPNPVPRFQL